MLAAVTTLALLALLAGARACDVRIVGTIPIDMKMLMAPYGEDITLFCSSDDTNNLAFLIDADYLQTEALNATTVRAIVKKPDVGPYEISCMDHSKHACGDYINLEIMPAITVTSAHVRHVTADNEWSVFFVPHGEDYEVFCSGNVVEKLDISSHKRHVSHERVLLRTDIVNETTVRSMVQANGTEEREYSCTMHNNYFIRPIIVIVDYYPEAHNFRCIYQEQNLECSWKSSSENNTFKLFYINSGELRLICADSSDGLARACTANVETSGGSLLLTTCNKVFCNNQTFSIESESILYDTRV